MTSAAVSFHSVVSIKTTDDTMTIDEGRTFTRRKITVTDDEGQTLTIDLFLSPDFKGQTLHEDFVFEPEFSQDGIWRFNFDDVIAVDDKPVRVSVYKEEIK